MNLLQGNFEGKVGEIYGAKQRGKTFAKAVPFSHAPHNKKQKNAFSAFQKLVRFSSGLVKYAWDMFGFQAKNMTKTNKMCQVLRPMVEGNVFNLEKFVDSLYKDGKFTLSNLDVPKAQTSLTVDFNISGKISTDAKEESFFCIVNWDGAVIAYTRTTEISGKISLIWEKPAQNECYLLAFNKETFNGFGRLRDATVLPL